MSIIRKIKLGSLSLSILCLLGCGYSAEKSKENLAQVKLIKKALENHCENNGVFPDMNWISSKFPSASYENGWYFNLLADGSYIGIMYPSRKSSEAIGRENISNIGWAEVIGYWVKINCGERDPSKPKQMFVNGPNGTVREVGKSKKK